MELDLWSEKNPIGPRRNKKIGKGLDKKKESRLWPVRSPESIVFSTLSIFLVLLFWRLLDNKTAYGDYLLPDPPILLLLPTLIPRSPTRSVIFSHTMTNTVTLSVRWYVFFWLWNRDLSGNMDIFTCTSSALKSPGLRTSSESLCWCASQACGDAHCFVGWNDFGTPTDEPTQSLLGVTQRTPDAVTCMSVSWDVCNNVSVLVLKMSCSAGAAELKSWSSWLYTRNPSSPPRCDTHSRRPRNLMRVPWDVTKWSILFIINQ
jgi:hypothetical protein